MVDYSQQQFVNRPVSATEKATFWEFARWVLLTGSLVALAATYCWMHMQSLNISYQMEQVRKENQTLIEINAALRAEQSTLLNPEQMDRQARKLGLVALNQAEVRIVFDDTPLLGSTEHLVAEALQPKKRLDE